MIEDVSKFNIPTSLEEEKERLSLCENCENKDNIDGIDVCSFCACPIKEYIIKYKFKLCPIGKWS